MKPNPKLERRNDGGTLIDLIVIVAVVVGAAMVILPLMGRKKVNSAQIRCLNNMKQVSTGLRLFANDNDSRYPDAVTNIASNLELWKLFQLGQNDISSPRILVCPSDTERFRAEDFLTDTGSQTWSNSFAHPSNRNMALSYFYAAGATEDSPNRMLIGDRYLTRDPKRSDKSPGPTLLTGTQRLGSTTNEVKDLRWASGFHERGGNVAFMDGSARQLTTSGKLRDAVMNTGDTTNCIWLPQ